MRKKIIGFPIGYFCGWMGGANIAVAFTNAVYLASQYVFEDISPILMMDVSNTDISIPTIGYLRINKNEINFSGVPKEFMALSSYDEIYLYKNLITACKSLNVDVLGPSYHNLGKSFEIPWSAYLPDFQHRHFPHFFSKEEINSRNISFGSLISDAPLIMVNSQTVIEDIKRFYTSNENNSNVKKFPLMQWHIRSDYCVDDTKKEFGVGLDYFIVCSQQWKHKSHDVVIRAFSEFLKQSKKDWELIITGEQADYRHPNLKSQINLIIDQLGLNHRVKYLGLIERRKQLALISGSRALVQASQIEGGPGASGVLEAAGLDVPIIASNIPANLEMSFGRHTFFTVDSVESLANTMIQKFPMADVTRFPITKNEADATTLSCGAQMIRTLIEII